MGKIIKSEKKGGGEESKFIEEYTPLKKYMENFSRVRNAISGFSRG
jgi:hypothetical protein